MEGCSNCRHWNYISGISGRCSYLSHYHDDIQVNSDVSVSEDFYCIEYIDKKKLSKRRKKDSK